MMNRKSRSYILYGFWLLILIFIIFISNSFEKESTFFHGIAETSEIVVNSESAVEIKSINCVEGQSVLKGALLVELSSPELVMKINQISHQLNQIKAEKGVNKAEIISKIDQLKAEKISKTSEINYQIKQLETQYKINMELTSGLKSIAGDKKSKKSTSKNPVIMRIDSLKKELSLSLRPLNIQINLLKKALNNSGSPLKIQVERLEKELELLKKENMKLSMYSKISGIIGAINFKPGEIVAPFEPILSIYTKTPSFVKGYIHENQYTKIGIGKKMKITSLADKKNSITGKVIGVGSRIVEYPMRLRRHPDLHIWGRNVMIQIPEKNNFILGEKVLISTTEFKNSSWIDKLKY